MLCTHDVVIALCSSQEFCLLAQPVLCLTNLFSLPGVVFFFLCLSWRLLIEWIQCHCDQSLYLGGQKALTKVRPWNTLLFSSYRMSVLWRVGMVKNTPKFLRYFFTPARKVPTAFLSSQTYLKECPFMLLSRRLGAFSQVIAPEQRTTRRARDRRV